MDKPGKEVKIRYNYLDCSHYLEEKYKYKERDYAGKYEFFNKCREETDKKFGDNGWFTTKPIEFTPEQSQANDYYNELKKGEPPYWDFWHFILDHCGIYGNGCDFTMYKDLMEEAEPWQKEILQHYFDEFDQDNTGEIEFNVSW